LAGLACANGLATAFLARAPGTIGFLIAVFAWTLDESNALALIFCLICDKLGRTFLTGKTAFARCNFGAIAFGRKTILGFATANA